MQNHTKLLSLFLFLSTSLFSQTIKVQPYLQNASPTSIFILWETEMGEESTVEWGLSEDLGNTTAGTAFQSLGDARIHEVQLIGLSPATSYFYKVQTGTAQSEIYKFKTPALASAEESFRMVIASDVQRDGSNPNKFNEIVEDGIITILQEEIGGDLSDNLGLVLISGDLVNNGNTYSQWENQFFTPGQNLFSQVPLYPVLGNHENNAIYYFQYFNLPENGTEGFEEHWWYKDYGNSRIIGLDSNGSFATQGQLDWLSEILDSTCEADSIDFVFAQLHHPHKSELWTPGESNFTGEVITLLENFSTNCGKPSIHFFGHTHGYSRGQSRDHKHLWINVATGGGAIDHWGEWPQFDYDEFTVSQAEWGFVEVEITAGDNPQFVVRRISRGNDFQFKDNEITDSLVVKMKTEAVQTPEPIFPLQEEVRPECVVLKANEFSGENMETSHGQSHWQISTDCEDFSDPVAESWRNYQNIYFNMDTQAGDDLTDEKIIGLQENTNYCWRVRYRDRALNWSEWSEPASFTTTTSNFSPNLLINNGAESDLLEWTIVEGIAEALTDGECDGISPHSGEKYFAVGGVCEDGPFGICAQNVNVITYADSIDTGNLQANFGGYLSNYNGSDLPSMRLIFISEGGNLLDSSMVFSTLNSNWTYFNEWVNIPIGTRIIQFELTGTRNTGSDNDSYFDDLFLRLGKESEECDEFVSSTADIKKPLVTLVNFPNPFKEETKIVLQQGSYSDLSLTITNNLGQVMDCPTLINSESITIRKGNLSPGTYFFLLKDGERYLGNGKFIIL